MNRIRELRRARGLNQEALAKILRVNRSAVSKYENEEIPLNDELLGTLADYFSVSTDYLLGRVENPSPRREKEKAPSELSAEEALMLALTKLFGREPTEAELAEAARHLVEAADAPHADH